MLRSLFCARFNKIRITRVFGVTLYRRRWTKLVEKITVTVQLNEIYEAAQVQMSLNLILYSCTCKKNYIQFSSYIYEQLNIRDFNGIPNGEKSEY